MGPRLQDWVAFGLENYTYYDFRSLHNEIRTNEHRTTYGKYYDDDWDAFTEDAIDK